MLPEKTIPPELQEVNYLSGDQARINIFYQFLLSKFFATPFLMLHTHYKPGRMLFILSCGFAQHRQLQ